MRNAVAAGVPWTRRRANPNGGNWNRYMYRSSSRPESVYVVRVRCALSVARVRCVRAQLVSPRETERGRGGGIECIVFGL